MVRGGELSDYRHALTHSNHHEEVRDKSKTHEKVSNVESVSSIESKVNKSIKCVAIRFIPQSVAKALKDRLDASHGETSTCNNTVY